MSNLSLTDFIPTGLLYPLFFISLYMEKHQLTIVLKPRMFHFIIFFVLILKGFLIHCQPISGCETLSESPKINGRSKPCVIPFIYQGVHTYFWSGYLHCVTRLVFDFWVFGLPLSTWINTLGSQSFGRGRGVLTYFKLGNFFIML